MRWPPNKAWTSCYEICGLRHFVAINYGGKLANRWVLLVSVLDGNVRLKVGWDDITNTDKWESGWLAIAHHQRINPEGSSSPENICLHASDDSGFLAGLSHQEVRPWDDLDNL